jgi:hypothetical protein
MKNLLIFLFLAGSTLLIYNQGAVDIYQSGNFIQDKFRGEKIAGHPERSRPERNSSDEAPSDRYHSR